MSYVIGNFARFYEPSEYRPKFFGPGELACKGSGALIVCVEALKKIDELRRIVGGPIRLTSAYRSPKHNAAVGGAPASYHVEGKAFDIVVGDHEVRKLIEAAKFVGFGGLGYYLNREHPFIHVDTGPVREWRG